VRDDRALIEQNPFLRRDGWLGQLLTSDFWGSSGTSSGMWRPLTLLSYWIDGRVSGWNPGWFHAVNVLAHAATSALVAALALAATASVPCALVAGLWFAAMPVHVESVGWIAGRTDVLCALFFLAALALDRRARRLGRRWPGPLALVALSAALASKEAAVPYVAVIAVAEWAGPRPTRERLAWLLPSLAVTVVYLVLHALFAGAALLPEYLDAAAQSRERWAGWAMLPGYLAFLWPWYPHSPEIEIARPAGPASVAVWAGAVFHLAAAVSLVAAIRRRAAGTAVAIAVLWLPLLPAIAVTIARGKVAFAERLFYVSSAGAAVLLGLGLAALPARTRRVALTVAGLLVLASAVATARLVPTWRNDATMYEAMVRTQPRNAKARVGHAESLLGEGRESEALAELERAESLDPRLPEAQVSRAIVHVRHREWAGALERSERALSLDSRRLDARMLEAQALFGLGRIAEARARLEGILRDHPAEPTAEAMLGQVLLVANDAAGAAPHLERAVGWLPSDPELWFALGNARLKSGRAAEASAAFAATVRLRPDAYEAWLRLAAACAAAGDPAGRDAALARAARLPQAADGRVDALRHTLGAP
jgi:tetratricopeptide (TPR) repeat protein